IILTTVWWVTGLLPGHLSGGASGHSPRALRGGGDRRRRRLAKLLVDHSAAAPAGVPVRAGHPRHRLVPDLRPGVRPHQRRPGRRDPDRGPAPLRDRLPELLPLRLRLGDGVGAVRGDPRVLAPPVPAPARPHAVLSRAGTDR